MSLRFCVGWRVGIALGGGLLGVSQLLEEC